MRCFRDSLPAMPTKQQKQGCCVVVLKLSKALMLLFNIYCIIFIFFFILMTSGASHVILLRNILVIILVIYVSHRWHPTLSHFLSLSRSFFPSSVYDLKFCIDGCPLPLSWRSTARLLWPEEISKYALLSYVQHSNRTLSSILTQLTNRNLFHRPASLNLRCDQAAPTLDNKMI